MQSSPVDLLKACAAKIRKAKLAVATGAKLVWASLVVADSGLMKPGSGDGAAAVVFSFDSHFLAHPQELGDLAGFLRRLRGSNADRSQNYLADIDAALRQPKLETIRCAVPVNVTAQRAVWLAGLAVQRHRLPESMMVEESFPVIADPAGLAAPMMVPGDCWADELAAQWSQACRKQLRENALPGEPIDDERWAANPITLTPAAAEEIRGHIEANGMEQAFVVVIVKGDLQNLAYELDLKDELDDAAAYVVHTSQELKVCTLRSAATAVAGLVIDFVGVDGRGYWEFKNPNAPS